MTEKFSQAVLSPELPDVQDKDQFWLVTFKVTEWRVPDRLRPLAASHISLFIRKSDGAVTSVK
jgi:hypothetical protein